MTEYFVENADRLSGGDFGEIERVVLLYEAAVSVCGSTNALENGVTLLLRSRTVLEVFAVELLDMFVRSTVPLDRHTESRISSDVLGALKAIGLKTCEELVFRCEGS